MIEVRFDFPVKSKPNCPFPAYGTVTLQMSAERIESKNEGGNCVFRVASNTDLSEHFTAFTDSAAELKRVKEERDWLQEHLQELGSALGFRVGTSVLEAAKFVRNELIDMGKVIGIHNPEMMPADELVKHLRQVVNTYFKSGLIDGPGNGLLYSHRQKLFALIYGAQTSRQGTSENVVAALTELERIRERMRPYYTNPSNASCKSLATLFDHAERRKGLEEKAKAFDEFLQLDREVMELNRQSMERRKLQRNMIEEFRR